MGACGVRGECTVRPEKCSGAWRMATEERASVQASAVGVSVSCILSRHLGNVLHTEPMPVCVCLCICLCVCSLLGGETFGARGATKGLERRRGVLVERGDKIAAKEKVIRSWAIVCF